MTPAADPTPCTPSRSAGATRSGLRRTDADVRSVVASWRRLTSPADARRAAEGQPTLLAVSGGCDSSALALALATTRVPLTIGHVVHDLRPRADALADRDATRRLAERLGLPFIERSISPAATGGNAESAARRLRYAALADMARERSLAFIATAHHADDQLETLLMALLRGSGPRGLSGVAERRRLAGSPLVTLVRPMLTIDRAAAERLCRAAGWQWQTDATNADATRLRAALRAEVLPRLRALRPAVAARAADTARLMHDLASHLDSRAAALALGLPIGPWPRAHLRKAPAAVVGELLRRACEHAGSSGLDRLSARSLSAAARLIASADTEPRQLRLGPHALVVDAHAVTLVRATGPER